MAGVDYSNLAGMSGSDIAKFILLNADVKRGAMPSTADANSPSVMARIFDVLSRPRYAVANFVKSFGDQQGPSLDAIWEGLSGKEKTSFTDVLEKMGVEKGIGRSAAGFALDVGLDPLNFIPVGAIASKISAAKAAKTVAPEVTGLQKFASKGELINPELFGQAARQPIDIPSALTAKAATSEPTFPVDALAEAAPTAANAQLRLDLPGLENIRKFDVPQSVVTKAVDEGIPRTAGQLAFKLPMKKTAAEIVDNPAAIPVVRAASTGAEFQARHSKIAEEILSKFKPSESKSLINKAHPDTLNPKQQVWLYYRALNAAKDIAKKPAWQASHANKIYAAIEDQLVQKGYVPRLGSGENVSLYDTIKQMGGPAQAKTVLDNFAKPLDKNNPIWDAVQGLRAANAIDESKSVKFILDKVSESKANLTTTGLSDGQVQSVLQKIKQLSKKTADVAPISPASTDAAKKLIDQVLQGGKSPVQVATEAKQSMINDILSKGGPRTEINAVQTRALEKSQGKLPAWAINDNKAAEFLMSRVATAWGQKDLRPLSLTAMMSSSATAAARGTALRQLFRGFDDTQRAEAWTLSQGFGTPSTPEVAQLSDQISAMMSNLVGQMAGHSVVTRSVLDMNLLNKWMRNYGVGFEFTKGKIKDITSAERDFSNGTDWLNSWKAAEIKGDPESFIFKFQQAIEQATREKALFDEMGERFGQKIPGGGFRIKVEGHPYLQGYYFSEDIAKQIPRVVKDWTNTLHTTDPLLKFYDRLLSMWKSGVTIYRPAHHIRNLIGDAYLGYMDGVNTVRPYTLAAKVQRTLKGMYPTLTDVDELVRMGVAHKGLATPAPGAVLFRNKTGVPFTAQQIAAVAHQKGLLEHARSIEDIIDLGEGSGFRPFGGKVQAVGRAASELVSHNSRLAHFIDKVMKSRGNNLEKIFEEASNRARKWHPTGLDLTPFERKFMRRIMPFYAWIRKSTPLLFEGLVMNPSKALVVPKAYNAIQDAQGMDASTGQPFPADQMFPEWLRAEGLGPLSGPDGWLGAVSNQQPPGYIMAGRGLNPLTQMISQLASPGRTLMSGLSPAIGIPIALASGKNLTTGEPITGTDARPGAFEEYVGSQIPIWSMAQGITGVTPFGTTTKKSQGDQAMEAIINWLTGAGIQGTGPYVKQAIYEDTKPKQLERTAAKNAFLDSLRNAQ